MRARSSRFDRGRLGLVIAVVAIGASGCTTTVVRPGMGAGVVAQLSLERFLQAANQRDLEGMGRIFGTEAGPVWDTGSTFGCMFKKIGSWFGGTACPQKRDVEVRMDAISRIMRHDDYRIVREETVAGRLGRATRVYVDLTVGQSVIREVPFVMVRDGDGQWLVEQVDLQRIMEGSTRRNNRAPTR